MKIEIPCKDCVVSPACDEVCREIPLEILTEDILPLRIYERILNFVERHREAAYTSTLNNRVAFEIFSGRITIYVREKKAPQVPDAIIRYPSDTNVIIYNWATGTINPLSTLMSGHSMMFKNSMVIATDDFLHSPIVFSNGIQVSNFNQYNFTVTINDTRYKIWTDYTQNDLLC